VLQLKTKFLKDLYSDAANLNLWEQGYDSTDDGHDDDDSSQGESSEAEEEADDDGEEDEEYESEEEEEEDENLDSLISTEMETKNLS